MRAAGTDFGQCATHPRERSQAQPDRDRVDRDHAETEQGKIDIELPLEIGDLRLEVRPVAHHPETSDALGIVEHELALEDVNEFLVEPHLDIATLEFGIERHLVGRRCLDRLDHRDRAQRPAQALGYGLDRPVPARARDRESEVTEIRVALQPAILGNADRADQIEQMRGQKAFEPALARLPEQGRDHGRDDDERQQRPERRKCDDADGQRTEAQPP